MKHNSTLGVASQAPSSELSEAQFTAALEAAAWFDTPQSRKDFRRAFAAAIAAGVALPHEAKQALRSGFMFGWKAAAVWANREDLIADIGSPAYEKDCDAACGVTEVGRG